MTKRWTICILVGILLLASFFRLFCITSTPPGLYIDEAMDGNNALQVIETGHMKVFYPEDNGREGLYINVLVPFIEVFGNQPWVVRLPAAIAGILTVLGIYFLGKEFFNKRVGLLAAFLLATSFWHINFSRIAFRAILAPLLVIWAMYFLMKAFRSSSGFRATLYSLAAGIIYGLGFYTYIAYRITPLLFLLFIPFFKTIQNFWKRSLIFIVIAVIVALPLGVYFLQHPADFSERAGQVSILKSPHPVSGFFTNIGASFAMFFVKGDFNWRHNIAGAPELFLPVGVLCIIGIGVGVYSLSKKIRTKKMPEMLLGVFSNFSIICIFVWLLLGLIPAAISNEGIPHALRSILALPPAMLLSALAGIWLYDVMRKQGFKNSTRILAILFIGSVAVHAYTAYFIQWAKNKNVPPSFNEATVESGKKINTLPTNVEKYVITGHSDVWTNGIPISAAPLMFVTNSYTHSMQKQKHITYVLPGQENQIPAGTSPDQIFYIY